MEAFAGKSFNDALDEKLKYVDSLSAEQADALHRDNLLIDFPKEHHDLVLKRTIFPLKKRIKLNINTAAELLGIEKTEKHLDFLVSLSAKQIAELLENFPEKELGSIKLDTITGILGEKCTPEIKTHLISYLERLKAVSSIKVGQRYSAGVALGFDIFEGRYSSADGIVIDKNTLTTDIKIAINMARDFSLSQISAIKIILSDPATDKKKDDELKRDLQNLQKLSDEEVRKAYGEEKINKIIARQERGESFSMFWIISGVVVLTVVGLGAFLYIKHIRSKAGSKNDTV